MTKSALELAAPELRDAVSVAIGFIKHASEPLPAGWSVVLDQLERALEKANG